MAYYFSRESGLRLEARRHGYTDAICRVRTVALRVLSNWKRWRILFQAVSFPQLSRLAGLLDPTSADTERLVGGHKCCSCIYFGLYCFLWGALFVTGSHELQWHTKQWKAWPQRYGLRTALNYYLELKPRAQVSSGGGAQVPSKTPS